MIITDVNTLSKLAATLAKAENEKKRAPQILSKLEQTLPIYNKAVASYSKLEKEGFFGGLATADKQRAAIEKAKDLDAQQSTVAALDATIAAQKMRISQTQSNYQSELQKELVEIRSRVAQLQPTLDKSVYKAGLMELKAPQDGIVKDPATTTVGAVVQPSTVVVTIVPNGEQLYADITIKNEDVGFVRVGQTAQVKLAAYPFQHHGMLTGTVIHISADATEPPKQGDGMQAAQGATYKARVRLDQQVFNDAHGNKLVITPGMQVAAEINQGKRTVLEYLLSPVRKTVEEAGRER